MEISPRTINDLSDRNYHHSDSTKAASTFQLDDPPPIEPTLPKPEAAARPAFSESSESSSVKINMKKRERPYLILDIREAEEFKRGRIVTSKSYPAVRLSRSVNYESKDMLKFKNIQGKMLFLKNVETSCHPRNGVNRETFRSLPFHFPHS